MPHPRRVAGPRLRRKPNDPAFIPAESAAPPSASVPPQTPGAENPGPSQTFAGAPRPPPAALWRLRVDPAACSAHGNARPSGGSAQRRTNRACPACGLSGFCDERGSDSDSVRTLPQGSPFAEVFRKQNPKRKIGKWTDSGKRRAWNACPPLLPVSISTPVAASTRRSSRLCPRPGLPRSLERTRKRTP
jgi:hypothetical protein